MKIIFEAEIEGAIPLRQLIEMKIHPYTIRLAPNDKNVLDKVEVEKPIPDFEKFIPRVRINPGRVSEIIFSKQEFVEEEKLMQHLESFGALDFGIKKIKWETPRITWVPENDEERSKLAMSTYKRSSQYDTPKNEISRNWLQDVLLHRNRISHLVEPLSFFRIGSNHYHNFNYSEAFLNFYLMLEGIFGGGHSKNPKVEEAFNESEVLNYAISEAFDFLDNDRAAAPHKAWLESYLNEKRWSYNNRHLIKAIVSIRGNLSHYYFKSSRKQRDCFNEKENESIALIAMMICMFSTIKLRIEPFRTDR